MSLSRNAAIALMSVLVVACGGGGSGGDGSGGNDDRGSSNLPDFDIGDVELYVIGFGAADATLTLGRLSADAFLAAEQYSFQDNLVSCGNGGTRSLRMNDRDDSGDFTVGDRLELLFSNCFGAAIGGVASGYIVLEAKSIAENDDGRTLTFSETLSNFRIGTIGAETTIEGGFDLIFTNSDSGVDTVQILLGNNTLRYGFSQGESVAVGQGSMLQKRYDFNADAYEFRFDQTLAIESEGERFSVYADTLGFGENVIGDFEGNLSEYPQAGVARFYIPGIGSQCVLAIGSDDRNVAYLNAPALRYSATGDDCMMDANTRLNTAWTQIVEDTLFSDVDSFNLRN